MKRRRVLIGIVVVVIVLAASLSTARARQVWSENQSHQQFAGAQQQAAQLLAAGRAEGLYSSQLQPLQQQQTVLQQAAMPASFPVFGSERERFYRRQAQAFHRLALDIQATIRAVTEQTRSAANGELSSFQSDITGARTIEADTSTAAKAYEQNKQSFDRALYPRQFRAIAAAVQVGRTQLAGVVAKRRAVISDVLARSGNTQAGVVQLARQQAASADGQLSQLDLFTSRTGKYRQTLTRLTNLVQQQTSAQQAAVKELRIGGALKTIQADYARTVPGKYILVSTESQSATMYEGGNVVYSTPVTTGGPELPTDHGVFHIYMKASPFEFHSPWPPGSPYYYPPTPVSYWMPFDGAEGLHDASWRSNFGAGSNLQPTDLGTGNSILGTHGCVNLPAGAAAFVWNWAPIGTTVVVV